MAIILAQQGKAATKLERTVIQEENYLQRYLDDHPDILPLDQLDPDIRPLVLTREFPTTSGPIDGIAVDQNANIYLIETKLYKNPDKRGLYWRRFSTTARRCGRTIQIQMISSLN